MSDREETLYFYDLLTENEKRKLAIEYLHRITHVIENTSNLTLEEESSWSEMNGILSDALHILELKLWEDDSYIPERWEQIIDKK